MHLGPDHSEVSEALSTLSSLLQKRKSNGEKAKPCDSWQFAFKKCFQQEQSMSDGTFDFDPLELGISLKFLRSLPFDPSENFRSVCTFIKELTKDGTGHKSLAMHLYRDPATRHLVSRKPYAFVSYTWDGTFGATMSALSRAIPGGQDDIYVWMDVAIVNQHSSTTTTFDTWATTFENSLRRIGRALLVLSPARNPLSPTRSWCCFEIYYVKATGIEYKPCTTLEDEEQLISDMRQGVMNLPEYQTIIRTINVEKAQAYQPSDQAAILTLLKRFGLIAVNDVILVFIKNWLIEVAKKAESRETAPSDELAKILNSRSALHYLLGDYELSLVLAKRSLGTSRLVSGNELNTSIYLFFLATLFYAMADPIKAESAIREAIMIREANPTEGVDRHLLEFRGYLGRILIDQHRYLEAKTILKEVLKLHQRVSAPIKAMEIIEVLQSLPDELVEEQWNKMMDDETEGLILIKAALPIEDQFKIAMEGGHYRQALSLGEKVLFDSRRIFGDIHPSVAGVLTQIATAKGQCNETEGLVALCQEALEINTKCLGGKSGVTLGSQHNLGLALEATGRYSEAEQIFRSYMASILELFNGQHEKDQSMLCSNAYLHVARVFHRQGKLEEARQFYGEAVADSLQTRVVLTTGLKSSKPLTGAMLLLIAQTISAQGDDVGEHLKAKVIAELACQFLAAEADDEQNEGIATVLEMFSNHTSEPQFPDIEPSKFITQGPHSVPYYDPEAAGTNVPEEGKVGISKTIESYGSDASALGYSPDGSRLVVGGSNGQIHWLDSTYQLSFSRKVHSDLVRCVAFNKTGSELATASDDATISIFTNSDFEGEVTTLKVSPSGAVRSVCFSPNGSFLASVSYIGNEKDKKDPREVYTTTVFAKDKNGLWSGLNRRVLARSSESGLQFSAMVQFNPSDGRWLAVGTHSVQIFDTSTWNCVQEMLGHVSVTSLCFNPDSSLLAVADVTQSITIYSKVDGWEKLKVMQPHTTFAFTMAFSPDGRLLAIGSFESPITLHDVENDWEDMYRLENPSANDGLLSIAFSPSESSSGYDLFLAAVYVSDYVKVWKVKRS